MKRSLVFTIAVFLFSPLFAQYYKVAGGSGGKPPFLAETNGTTSIYLLKDMEGAEIQFTSSQPGRHQWYRYEKSIDDAVPVPPAQITQSENSNVSVITGIQEGYGYYVDAPMVPGFVWIVNYSSYFSHISGLEALEDEYNCERLKLSVKANVPDIQYYTSRGTKNVLKRKFHLTYNTLEWQENDRNFTSTEESKTYQEIFPEIVVEKPPLADTEFMLTDSFNIYFEIEQQFILSEKYSAVKVEAHAFYEKDGENENHSFDGAPALGKSGPISYTFTAYANEPAATYYIWNVLKQDTLTGEYSPIARNPDYTDPVFRYTFDIRGHYRVELEVKGAQSTCVAKTAIDVVIDPTRVIIPNAFSPGSSPGVNDELRISLTSVKSFRASVYNRWGNLLYQWTDPAKGWNGMVNGKFVPTGAYFVVVEYTDADGKKQAEKRDVSILRGKN